MTNNMHFGMDNVGPLYFIHPGIKVIVDPLVRVPNGETCRKGWLFSRNTLPDGKHSGIVKLPDDDNNSYNTHEYKS